MSKCQVVTAFIAVAAALIVAPGCARRCERSANGASPCADGTSYYVCTDSELGPTEHTATCPATRSVCRSGGPTSHECVAADPLPCAKEIVGKGFDSGLPHLEAVDLDGDGTTDVVFGDRSGVNRMLAKGDRTYQPAAPVVTSGPNWCLADVDGDGRVDLLHGLGLERYDLGLALGRGDGTFAASVPFRPGLRAWIGACGDLDGDGGAEVVTIDQSVALEQQRLVVLSSRQSFQPSGGFPSWPASAVRDSKVVPLRAGRAALIVESEDRSADLFVHGAQQAVAHLPNLPIAVADFNGDGFIDLLFSVSPAPLVYLGNGEGAFTMGAQAGGTAGAAAAVAADFDGDGRTDLELLDQLPTEGATSIRAFRGRGDGTFTAAPQRFVFRLLYEARPAFVDHTGRADVIAYAAGAPGEIRILSGGCALAP